jgi:hypothetical protein
MLDSLDAWLVAQPSLVNARKRSVYPVVLQRQALADALTRHLQALGLDRRAPKAPSLEEYLGRYRRAPAEGLQVGQAVAGEDVPSAEGQSQEPGENRAETPAGTPEAVNP